MGAERSTIGTGREPTVPPANSLLAMPRLWEHCQVPPAVSVLVIVIGAWALFLALFVVTLAFIRRRADRHAPVERRRGSDRRRGLDRRTGSPDRRTGMADPRDEFVERRRGPVDRRSGRDRRGGSDRRGSVRVRVRAA